MKKKQILRAVDDYLEMAISSHNLDEVTIEVSVDVIPRKTFPVTVGYVSLEHRANRIADFGRPIRGVGIAWKT